MATRLGTILQFRRKFPIHTICVIVAEHRGSYTAVPVGSEEHKKFAANENNTCTQVDVRKYLREQLIREGYIQPKKRKAKEKQNDKDRPV